MGNKEVYPNKLKYYIDERGLRTEDIANALNLSVAMLNKHISGVQATPRERRNRLAAILGYPVDVLFPLQTDLQGASSDAYHAPGEVASQDLLCPAAFSEASAFLPLEVTNRDCASWFSERVASIIAFIMQWKQKASFANFQVILNKELKTFDSVKALFPIDTYFLSRRSALLVIAALPTGLLHVVSKVQEPFIEEEFLPTCAASITACWYLLNGREFASVEQTLVKYLPYLRLWARRRSRYQRKAAILAAQGWLLLGFIELHRLHFQERVVYCREAVTDAREAEDRSLLVKALTQLGNALYDQQRYDEMLRVYQETFRLLHQPPLVPIPSTLRSKVYMGLAHAHAQHGHTREALQALSKAQDLFPGENDDELPPYLSADEGSFSLILFNGWVHLDLGKRERQKEHAVHAERALAQIERFPGDVLLPERIRIEIVNRRAQAAVASGDLEAFEFYTLAGIESLRTVESVKRRQEVVSNYRAARECWPSEERVLALAEALL